jgi:hypothetical protein
MPLKEPPFGTATYFSTPFPFSLPISHSGLLLEFLFDLHRGIGERSLPVRPGTPE